MLAAVEDSGTADPPHISWWHWKRLPHHLGRARTSTVILSVLFLAIFTLYLNVRPDDPGTRTTPAGGGSDVEAPLVPGVPTEPTAPETTGEPAPTTEPEETGTPTTSRTPTSSSPGTTDPTTAAPGTIRGDLGRDWGLKVQQNLVHGSDSPESAAREIALWFPTL